MLTISIDEAKENSDDTVITVSEEFIKALLTSTRVRFLNRIVYVNNLTLEERVRLGNWYMVFLATEVGKIEAPMTRKEMIDYLKSFDDVDPTGEMEVVCANGDTMTTIDSVSVEEYGEEKMVVIR